MRLMIVGRLDGHLSEASRIAIKLGAKVSVCATVEQAIEALRSGQGAELMLADVVLDIEKLVDELDKERIHMPIVACGLESTLPEVAAKAIAAGASEYLSLPPDPNMIAAVLASVSNQKSDFWHRDPKMAETIALANRVAKSEATVLITGESGSGKEVMARHIHRESKRADGPFIAINCAAIPETLLESELFGHEKGSFSGAVARRIGKFEEAHGGTLLLDEVTEMEIRLQPKLLRVIQERIFNRVGGNETVKVDVRLIATSNRNLADAVRDKKFREDLYYRLNVVNVRLPPLRERPEDIRLLAAAFAKKFAKEQGISPPTFSKGAKEVLVQHVWPGNVRELENTIHRAVLLCTESEIDEGLIEFPPTPRGGLDETGGLVGKSLAEVERQVIIRTLDHCLGNMVEAASILGLSIRDLSTRLDTYVQEGTWNQGRYPASDVRKVAHVPDRAQ